ncbi:hypothetical protein Tco_0355021 [Tanacetum coccineum]
MLTKPQFFYDSTTKQVLGFQNLFYLQKAQQSKPKLYVGDIIFQTNPIMILDSEETLALAEESHSKMLSKHKDNMMLEKEKQVDTTPIDYVTLNKDFSTRFVLQTELSPEQAFWSKNSMNSLEPTLSIRPTNVEVPKELPKVSMVNTSLKKLKHHLANFDVVVKERTTPTAITEGSWGFEHTKACFRDEIIPFVKALMDLFSTFNQHLVNELSKVQNVFYQMEQAVEQHRIESKTFEVKMNQVLNKNEPTLGTSDEQRYCELQLRISFVINDNVNVLECKSVSNLRLSFKQILRKNLDKVDKIKQDLEEIETINIELDHMVTKLIAENEHLKQTYKQLMTSNYWLDVCYSDELLSVSLDGLHFDDKLHFVEELVEIMDREVKQLKRIRIPIVKVRWNSKRGLEFTWEHKDQFRKKYPHLFAKTAPSRYNECVSKDVMCLYLHSLADIDEQTKLKSLYLDKIEEYERLKLELSKHTENVEQMKNDTVCKQKGSTEIIAISELKKLIDKIKGKGVDTNFEKLSILGKPPLQPIRNQPVVLQWLLNPSPQRVLLMLYSGGGIPFQLKSDSLPHAHAQTTKTYYKHQESIKLKIQRQRLPQALIPIKCRFARWKVYEGFLLQRGDKEGDRGACKLLGVVVDLDAWVDIPMIDEDEVIPEDETPKIEATIIDMLSNQFRDVEEYAYHLEQAKKFMKNQVHKRTYKIKHWKVRDNPKEVFSDYMIIEVVRIITKQQYGLDFMQQIIVMRENDKPASFSEADFKYLNKNDIEDMYYLCLNNKVNYRENKLLNSLLTFIRNKPCLGLIYLNKKEEKRVMDMVDIPKFCNATLEKVLKEVKLKIFKTEFKMKTPLLGKLDLKIMEAYEQEIVKRLNLCH